MPTLTWGDPGDRSYENGLDRGVLYLPDGSAVPWNGLISVDESKDNQNVESVFYDGVKINDFVTPGNYAAKLRAVMYPPEFEELESMGELRRGVVVNDQMPQTFGLSYRTMVGNEVRGGKASYKLHVLYNLTALPADRSYSTQSSDPSLVEFEWDLSAVPEEVPGFRPTAHLTFKSEKLDPFLLEDLQEKLYGSLTSTAYLPPMSDLIDFISNWVRVRVIENNDGTWTLVETRPGFISPRPDRPEIVDIDNVNAVYLDSDQTIYEISDTVEAVDLVDIRVMSDGTWVAITDNDSMLNTVDGVFTLRQVSPVFTGPDMFRIESNTSNH